MPGSGRTRGMVTLGVATGASFPRGMFAAAAPGQPERRLETFSKTAGWVWRPTAIINARYYAPGRTSGQPLSERRLTSKGPVGPTRWSGFSKPMVLKRNRAEHFRNRPSGSHIASARPLGSKRHRVPRNGAMGWLEACRLVLYYHIPLSS